MCKWQDVGRATFNASTLKQKKKKKSGTFDVQLAQIDFPGSYIYLTSQHVIQRVWCYRARTSKVEHVARLTPRAGEAGDNNEVK